MAALSPEIHVRRVRRPWQQPYFWFIIPALIAYGILFLYPTIRSFYLSFFDWNGRGPIGDFIGIQNFRDVFASPRFWQAAWNSLQLFVFIFIFQNTVSLGLAVMLNRRSFLTHIYRAIIFLPQIMSAVATGILWVLMLDPIIGVVNPILRDIGLGDLQRQWQSDPGLALKTVMVVMAWQWNGMAVVLYLAGLQNVPEDLRHAALGGTGWRAGWRDAGTWRPHLQRCVWAGIVQHPGTLQFRHGRGDNALPVPGDHVRVPDFVSRAS
jgi:raffinose/stachyose/melibiose transport system permease protein